MGVWRLRRGFEAPHRTLNEYLRAGVHRLSHTPSNVCAGVESLWTLTRLPELAAASSAEPQWSCDTLPGTSLTGKGAVGRMSRPFPRQLETTSCSKSTAAPHSHSSSC